MLGRKQADFVAEYLIDLNATQAAIRAKYSPRAAAEIGYENLRKPHIAAAIAAGRAEQAKRTEVTADRVVTGLAKLGFANMADYMRVGADGDPRLNFSSLTRDQAAALQEVTVESFTAPGEELFEDSEVGGDTLEEQPHGGALRRPAQRPAGREVRRVKFKLADKLGALNSLGRHLGIFDDKLHVTGTLTLEQLVIASFKKDA